jgi:hypothetical protein
MRVLYFVYDTGSGPSIPLAPGTALFARVREPGKPDRDLKWVGDEWVEDEYLGYLCITGSPGLDNIDEAQLPEFVDRIS